MTSLAQVVAALSESYKDEGVIIWLRAMRRRGITDAETLAHHVRLIGDCDPDDFIVGRPPGPASRG